MAQVNGSKHVVDI